jgi:hypothetical protein
MKSRMFKCKLQNQRRQESCHLVQFWFRALNVENTKHVVMGYIEQMNFNYSISQMRKLRSREITLLML